jgi:anti-sigma B factor antagonist
MRPPKIPTVVDTWGRKMEFGVAKEQTGRESWLVRPRGEVDLYAAPAFRTELLSVIDSGARNVIVDLSETTFIDSTALGVLLAIRKRLSSGTMISIVSADRNILRSLEITGLDRVFRIYATVELALNANGDAAPNS